MNPYEIKIQELKRRQQETSALMRISHKQKQNAIHKEMEARLSAETQRYLAEVEAANREIHEEIVSVNAEYEAWLKTRKDNPRRDFYARLRDIYDGAKAHGAQSTTFTIGLGNNEEVTAIISYSEVRKSDNQ